MSWSQDASDAAAASARATTAALRRMLRSGATLVLALAACSESQTPLVHRGGEATLSAAAGGSNADAKGAGASGCAQATGAVPDAKSDSGVIVLRLSASDVDVCSAHGSVVGQEGLALQSAADGALFVAGLAPGVYDVLVSGNHPSAGLDAPAADVGVRVTGVRVSAGQKVEQSVRLFGLGALSGTAKLAGQKSHAGIAVQIPGTSFAASTDATGHYTISSVPAGQHDVTFDASGYHSAAMSAQRVYSDGTASVPDVVLVAGAGEGTLALLDAQDEIVPGDYPVVTSRQVRFVIAAKGHPTLMKIAEDSDFANLEWQPFASLASYTFKKDGLESGGRTTKRLSVKTLDGAVEGELGKAVVVDMFAETRGQKLFTLVQADEAGEPRLGVTAKLTVPANATEMRLSLNADFRGALWEPAAAEKTLPVAAPDDYTVYVQFRDRDLLATDVASQIATVTLFAPGSVDFTVTAATIAYPATPTFAVTGIKTPLKTGVKLMLARKADFSDGVEVALADPIPYALGGNADCGKHTLYLRVRYTDPATSVTFANDLPPAHGLEYRCFLPLPALPGEPNEGFALGLGNNQMFTWSGGQVNPSANSSLVDYGNLLDLATGALTAVNPIGAPRSRAGAKTFWTGSRFLVYSGYTIGATTMYFDGGLYDPAAQSWTAIPAPTDLPDVRSYSSSLSSLIDQTSAYIKLVDPTHLVLYGYASGDASPGGFIYDLSSGTWTTMPTTGTTTYAPSAKWVDPAAPVARCNSDYKQTPRPVWAGGRLIIWSGFKCGKTTVLDGGAMYDPTTNQWTTMATDGAPASRYDNVAVPIGDELFVWGGRTRNAANEEITTGMEVGAIFNPAQNTWRPVPAAPFAMSYGAYRDLPGLTAAVIGGKIVLWGGWQLGTRLWRGLVFDPQASTWKEMSLTGAPRYLGTVSSPPPPASGTRAYRDVTVADDRSLYVITRARDRTELASGANLAASYDPATDTWRPLPTTSNDWATSFLAPAFRDLVRVLPTAAGLLELHGYAPDAATTYDQVQMSATIQLVR